MATGGKTTIAKELARSIPNAAYLSRDDAMYGGLLLVNDIGTRAECLPPFQTYVREDAVFPDFVAVVETPFGPMHQVNHSNHNEFFFRHADNQSYTACGRMAERLLEIGKVVVIDAWFSPAHFASGKVKAFFAQSGFASYPHYLIYVTVDPQEAFRRWHARARTDPESDLRGKAGYLNWDTFLARTKREQIPNPSGLEEIPHLLLDTTCLALKDSLALCFSYIRS